MFCLIHYYGINLFYRLPCQVFLGNGIFLNGIFWKRHFLEKQHWRPDVLVLAYLDMTAVPPPPSPRPPRPPGRCEGTGQDLKRRRETGIWPQRVGAAAAGAGDGGAKRAVGATDEERAEGDDGDGGGEVGVKISAGRTGDGMMY